MPDLLVSVVVPIYNVEQHLDRCLSSIIRQQYRPIEIILVDDGSTDGSASIIRQYETAWPFIRSIRQENQGAGAARDAGMALAAGEYLALVDGDDYVDPDHIRRLVDIAEKSQADIVICGYTFDFLNGFKLPCPVLTFRSHFEGALTVRSALDLFRMPPFVWNRLYRRNPFAEHGIAFPSFYYEDVAAITCLMLKMRRVAITRKPSYHYCWRRTGISGSFGMKNVIDYLKAVDMIRNFIIDENLLSASGKAFRAFLRDVRVLLYFQAILHRRSIPIQDRRLMIRQIRNIMSYASKG
jgi:glycosyltransferase involved in cell wall biosynthesis